MTKIVKRNLPHAVSTSGVRDATVREKIDELVGNIRSLKSQLVEAQTAIEELQRRH